MMNWTDRHCRYFHRLLSQHVRLYTEMIVADAVIHGDRRHLLGFDPVEHPVALQIGGSDPEKMSKAAQIGADWGYDEININVGCPSDRVQSGRFGACLMGEPQTVVECFQAMQAAVDIPVTIKCRLGIDDQNVEETLPQFIAEIGAAGCTQVIIHARKARLDGLSPGENRAIPPLDYGLVRRMKAGFPETGIVLNGGLQTLDAAMEEVGKLDGVMFGRAAYQDPWILSDIDRKIYGALPFARPREDIVRELIAYARTLESSANSRSARALVHHVTGLYAHQPGARLWRRTLSEQTATGRPPSAVIQAALDARREMSAA